MLAFYFKWNLITFNPSKINIYKHEQVGILLHFFHMDNQLSYDHLLNILSFSQSYSSQAKNKISIYLHTFMCGSSLDFSFGSVRGLFLSKHHSKFWYLGKQFLQTFSFFSTVPWFSFLYLLNISLFQNAFVNKWLFYI